MSALNAAAFQKAVVFLGGERRKGKMWNGPNKTTKDHNYLQLARKDLLLPMFVTLDTTHLLMSALNEEAPEKAVVFGRRKKKGQMWNGPNKTTKDHNYQQLARRHTVSHVRHTWHDPVAEVGVKRGSTHKGCCVWEEEEERVHVRFEPNKTTMTTKWPPLSLISRQDLLWRKDVILDTFHWLMSALNEEAPWKAVVFGRRKKKSVKDVKWTK
jgi:hypothetical protein